MDRLEQARLREYHAAMERMLTDRIIRLNKEIREMTETVDAADQR